MENPEFKVISLFYEAQAAIGKLLLSMDRLQTRVQSDVFLEGLGHFETKITTTGLG